MSFYFILQTRLSFDKIVLGIYKYPTRQHRVATQISLHARRRLRKVEQTRAHGDRTANACDNTVEYSTNFV